MMIEVSEINENIKRAITYIVEKTKVLWTIIKNYFQKYCQYLNKRSLIALTTIISFSIILTFCIMYSLPKNIFNQTQSETSFFSVSDDDDDDYDDYDSYYSTEKDKNSSKKFAREPYSIKNLRNGVFLKSKQFSEFDDCQKLFPKYVVNAIKKARQSAAGGILSQSSAITKDYINTLLELPWFEKAKENNNIEDVKNIINGSHLGMEEVKKEIIEFLAVRLFQKKKHKKVSSSINALCLYGAPGTGKTTLCKAIAKALHRPFQKISLTGVNETFTISGLDKAYVGAKCGRIINAIRESRFNNPVILLDEIDKVNRFSLHGDPLSPLLEILDPAQNKTFCDKYLEIPFDVSDVLFILTANNIEKIPIELYDRIRLIRIRPYCAGAKKAIAKYYSIPRILKNSGLNKNDIIFTENGLNYLVQFALHEGGMRGTNKRIIDIVNGIITDNNGDMRKIKGTKISQKEISLYCGHPPNARDKLEKDTVGAINGLAVTGAGTGVTMPYFVKLVPGQGLIKCIGNSKDNKKDFGIDFTEESIKVSLTYIRNNLRKFGIDGNKFNKNDFVFVFPWLTQGPSAGSGITACIISVLKNKPIRHDVAITGEIKVDGRVGAIGGAYEKVTGAYDSGIRHIIVPYENYDEVASIPKKYIKNAHIYYVKTFDEVLDIVF